MDCVQQLMKLKMYFNLCYGHLGSVFCVKLLQNSTLDVLKKNCCLQKKIILYITLEFLDTSVYSIQILPIYDENPGLRARVGIGYNNAHAYL